MADMPPYRVQQCRAFSKIGVDYASPLPMQELRLRKSRQYKVYIAVFVCMAVKCVHLEPVLDLSTDAFLAAFNRFIARRGLPTNVYSDCGTNFVGAARQLRSLVNHVDNQPHLIKSLNCNWHFDPPSAPHFGGIWEAAVKSTKSLLIRTIGALTTMLEEFTTLLARVESVLNSRPLTPLSNWCHYPPKRILPHISYEKFIVYGLLARRSCESCPLSVIVAPILPFSSLTDLVCFRDCNIGITWDVLSSHYPLYHFVCFC